MSQEANPAGPSGKPRWLGYTQLAAILLAIVVALYLARAPDRVDRGPVSSAAQAAPVVSVVKPASTEHVVTVNLTGSVKVERRATVRSEVRGRVLWVSPDFTPGGAIAADQPFVRLDPRRIALKVEAAKMRVGEAEAEVRVERAQAEEDMWSFARDNPGADIPDWLRRRPSIARAEAALGRARAAQALAELRLEQTEISLPFDAHVVSSDVEVGEIVGSAISVGRSAKLGVVYRQGALQVRAPIEPGDLSALAPVIGRSARIRTRSGTHEAEVVRTSSVISPKTRLTAVFLKFSEGEAPESLPAPGTFARIEIFGPKREDVYMLPESAARERDSVWVVRGGALEAATPRTVDRTAAGWVVEAFDAGDGVVIGTLFGARQGLKVKTAAAQSSK